MEDSNGLGFLAVCETFLECRRVLYFGAILFLIYVNALYRGAFNVSLSEFADDTALCYPLMTRHIQIQADLDRLKYWFY